MLELPVGKGQVTSVTARNVGEKGKRKPAHRAGGHPSDHLGRSSGFLVVVNARPAVWFMDSTAGAVVHRH